MDLLLWDVGRVVGRDVECRFHRPRARDSLVGSLDSNDLWRWRKRQFLEYPDISINHNIKMARNWECTSAHSMSRRGEGIFARLDDKKGVTDLCEKLELWLRFNPEMSSVPNSGSRVFKRHSFCVLILSGGQQKLRLLTRNWCQMLWIVLAVHAPLPHLERIGICPLKWHMWKWEAGVVCI